MRSSPRKSKRIRYKEEDDDEEEEEEDQEDDEQPSTSTQNSHNHKAQKHKRLSVSCGNKRGVLHVEKFKRGEACIKSEDRWFRPRDFEGFGGKASSKKWKYSISHKNKPLQFWLEQGTFTTKVLRRRETEPKKKKKRCNRTSENSPEDSEMQLVGETEEEESSRETDGEEETKRGDESEAEDDGMEDEDTPAAADDEERETTLIISISERSALQKEVKVAVKRLPELQATRDYNVMVHQPKDSWCVPSGDEETENSSSEIDEPIHSSSMSDLFIVGGVEEENGEEFAQSNGRRGGGWRERQTETPSSPPSASSANSKPEILNEIEDIGSTSNPTADLSATPVLLVTRGTNTRDVWVIKEESTEAISECSPTKPQSVLLHCKYKNTVASTSGRDAAQLQAVTFDTRVPQTSRASDSPHPSNMAEGLVSTSNPDTMDLDQLKRVKIKMQLKVLKLQDEYYTLKIKELKK